MMARLFIKKTKEKEKLNGKGKINNGLIYEILKDNTCFIIEEKSNKIISKLKFKDGILSIICLDNEDLIFEQKTKILIYRIIEKNYSFFQVIDIGKGDYATQEIITFYGCTGNDKLDKRYTFYKIHTITGNRFILCSNYGLKFYGQNEESKKYEIIHTYLFDYEDIQSIKNIKEINQNNFSVKVEKWVGTSMSGPAHFKDETYLISLNKEEKKEEIEDENEIKDFFSEYLEGKEKENEKEEKETTIEDLEKFLAV